MKLDPERLSTLSAVLRTGSFEAAAQELGITQSAVSQRIKLLEDKVGARLVLRETPCLGTEAGMRLAAHANQVQTLENLLARELDLSTGKAAVPINIAITVDSASTWLFESFKYNRDFLFEFDIDNQDFSDALLRKGQVVGAITANGEPIAGCDCHALGMMVYVPTATPAFIQEFFSDGVSVVSLQRAPTLRFNIKDRVHLEWIRKYFGTDLTPPYHSIATKQGYVNANLAGLGWGMQHIDLVAPHLESGALQVIKENAEFRIPLYWQTSRIWRDTLSDITRSICQTARKRLPQS